MSEGALPLTGALLALVGSLFYLTAAVGLLRLPDFYSRAHAPTKAATLGLLLCALGSSLVYGTEGNAFWLEKLLLMLFVLLTAPVSAQLLVRGAVARQIPQTSSTRGGCPLRDRSNGWRMPDLPKSQSKPKSKPGTIESDSQQKRPILRTTHNPRNEVVVRDLGPAPRQGNFASNRKTTFGIA